LKEEKNIRNTFLPM